MPNGVLVIHGVNLVDKEFRCRPGHNSFDQITKKLDFYFDYASREKLVPVICGKLYAADISAKSIRKALLYFKDKSFYLAQEQNSREPSGIRRSLELLLEDFGFAKNIAYGDTLNVNGKQVAVHSLKSESNDNESLLRIVIGNFNKFKSAIHHDSVGLCTSGSESKYKNILGLNKIFRSSQEEKGNVPQMAHVSLSGEVQIIDVPHDDSVFDEMAGQFAGSLSDKNSQFVQKLKQRIEESNNEKGTGFVKGTISNLPERGEKEVFFKSTVQSLYDEVEND